MIGGYMVRQWFGSIPALLALIQLVGAPLLASDARRAESAAGMMLQWSQISVDASGLDHSPPDSGGRTFGEHLGPGRASRAVAIVHLAMFEAVNAIENKYKSYAGIEPAGPEKISMEAAIAQAAHDTLNVMFRVQSPECDRHLAQYLGAMPDTPEKQRGIDLGGQAALAVLAMRAGDFSELAEPRIGIDYIPSDEPGKWRQDPISQHPLALGARWAAVRPFVLDSADQFRTPPPPALTSRRYLAAYEEVKRLGGDGIATPTERTREQTEIGIFWAYDGTPSLCAPPRLYNQLTYRIAQQMGTTEYPLEMARLLALVNVAMADAGIAIWESKYYYYFWRPVGGIREADPGAGPTGLGDGNPATLGDARFSPLGAPASNLTGPNFTPPFPAYPSGHAGFGGALFQILRRFYGRDDIAFTFVSDEFNGVTKGNDGVVRPRIERSFRSFSQAEEENGQSRIYLGIHWAFDKSEGIHQGRRVADYVYDNLFPLKSASQP
jgi:hypothetical protein